MGLVMDTVCFIAQTTQVITICLSASGIMESQYREHESKVINKIGQNILGILTPIEHNADPQNAKYSAQSQTYPFLSCQNLLLNGYINSYIIIPDSQPYKQGLRLSSKLITIGPSERRIRNSSQFSNFPILKYIGPLDEKYQAQGSGKWHHQDGGIYEGEFKEGLRNGYGKYKWPSGQIFEGNWNSNIKQGLGKMIFVSGYYEEGQFVNGMETGIHMYCSKEGKILQLINYQGGKEILRKNV
ncbi:hypothetical protein FGO68_gene14875 [Halteria grandinella]|uniref:MORN repeat protein n=1 Tax=Halteria grandinella TaxID=5974 RepID=A0A8J8NTK4_HALGN|nr:hypothetical protein FGO68_gene14875 [Halteria grandinella]